MKNMDSIIVDIAIKHPEIIEKIRIFDDIVIIEPKTNAVYGVTVASRNNIDNEKLERLRKIVEDSES